MVKPYFTRKNLIVIALAFFYCLIVVFTGLCIDGAHDIMSKKNLFNLIAQSLGFQSIAAGPAGLVTLVLICVYVVLYVAAVCYIRRYAITNGHKPTKPKYIVIYVLAFLLCAVLSIGVGCLIQGNLKQDIVLLLK